MVVLSDNDCIYTIDSDIPEPRLKRSLDGLPLKENLNFLVVEPRDDLVSG